jgi:undecaprenyl-diphosphatase
MVRLEVARADAAVDAWIERARQPALDHAAYALSSAADHSLLWFALGAVRAARTGDGRWLLRMASAQAIESFATNVVVKSWFRRVRPAREVVAVQPWGLHIPVTSSFPSGHATAAFTAAAFFSEDASPVATVAWYTLAAAVAASRVYVRLHHASDVVAGAALGVAFGATLRRLLPSGREPARP